MWHVLLALPLFMLHPPLFDSGLSRSGAISGETFWSSCSSLPILVLRRWSSYETVCDVQINSRIMYILPLKFCHVWLKCSEILWDIKTLHLSSSDPNICLITMELLENRNAGAVIWKIFWSCYWISSGRDLIMNWLELFMSECFSITHLSWCEYVFMHYICTGYLYVCVTV